MHLNLDDINDISEIDFEAAERNIQTREKKQASENECDVKELDFDDND